MLRHGVLVVDDSSFARKSVGMLIEKEPHLFVAGIARDGSEAVEKVQRLRPAVVTMDVEMPEMDGLAALEKVMEACPVPVVMLSNYTEDGADVTLRALELGAVDFFLKSELLKSDVGQDAVDDFLRRLRTIAESARIPQRRARTPAAGGRGAERAGRGLSADLLIIGTSTGGPAALQCILPLFPKSTPVPILVLQHMPPGFTKSLAERFDSFCNLRVKEAEDGEVLEAGRIYIAPAGYQTLLRRTPDGRARLKIEESADERLLYRPSVDVTLDSAAPIYGERLLAVILTGMGNDGLKGCRMVKKHNGRVIVEAEESCVVYGMPRAVFEAGLSDAQAPLEQVFEKIMDFM